jgi:hypothetical protein
MDHLLLSDVPPFVRWALAPAAGGRPVDTIVIAGCVR